MKGVEHKSGGPALPPEPRPRAVADQEVVQLFVAQLRRQILQEANPAGDRRSKGGRTVEGRKIHALVDSEGLPMRVLVHSAAIQDRDGAGLVLDKIGRRFPWLELIGADGGYNAWQVDAAVAKVPRLRLACKFRSFRQAISVQTG